MITQLPWPALGSALAAGLAGSAHCFAMCGGMAGALGLRARASATTTRASFHAALHQIGRVAGYTLAGSLVGALSAGTQMFLQLLGAALLLRMAAGALTLLIAARLLYNKNFLAPLERWGARVWRHLRPLARFSERGDAWFKSLVLGLLWGWLPCGMVYSVLLIAATTGSTAAGAATMMSFGVGTLPAMLGSSWLASRLPMTAGRPGLRAVSGVLLALFGAWTLLQPLLGHGHVHVH